jgi:hypothetical protein
MVLSGCGTLPLGGMSVGQSRPVGARGIDVGMSMGAVPNIAGTAPELRRDNDHLVNPIPADSALTAEYAFLDFQVAASLTDWLELGASFSRGVYAVARVARGERWALSLSPALFLHSENSRGPLQCGEWLDVPCVRDDRSTVRNLNLTGLVAFTPQVGALNAADLYVGAGMNAFAAHVAADDRFTDHSAVVPTILIGGMGMISRMRFTLEAQRTWITQRNGRRDGVATLRAYGMVPLLDWLTSL